MLRITIMKIVADVCIPFVSECFSSIGEVEAVSSQEITPAIVSDADCLLVRTVTPVDSGLLAESSVRFVGTATTGFDHIDVDFLRGENIGFASMQGSNANSVAEYVIAGLLEIAQKYNFGLEDKSIGVIGVGNIGRRVSEKAAAVGMKVCLNDPPLRRQSGDLKYLPIEELFDCDFITLHTPLTFEGSDKTYHLADEEFFRSLKAGCIFFNTSRGRVVETNALKAAIRGGGLKAAVLDVWEDEPDIDTGLLEMVDIGTPHIAGHSLDGRVAGMITIYREACKYFGVEAKFDVESFLPEPAVPQLKLNLRDVNEQDVLSEAVKRIYDIKEDDARLRRMLDKSAERKGEFFNRLSDDYPVRREFQNTRIVIADSRQRIADSKKIAKKLKGIGFLLPARGRGQVSQE